MLILVINCGSSSAKYELFDIYPKEHRSLTKGIVDRIGTSGKDHHAAIRLIADILTDRSRGVISSRAQIKGIGHRVVHGGETFKRSTLVTGQVIDAIERYSGLAPLHNPPSLFGIKACLEIFKGTPQAAVFDTAFHQTMPAKAFLYGIPLKFYKRYGIRRYGFHGTSHRFVSQMAAERLKRPLEDLKLVTCHLGNGCSMTAVDRGRSVDTSMGFTPLEGLVMGTRSGDLDPAIVLYLLQKEHLSAGRINDILNKKSGLLGVSGVSNDMRDIVKSARRKTQSAKRSHLAIDMFVYRIEKYIGAYTAGMGGLDAVVFTAGIGENHPWLVRRIRKDLKGALPKGVKFLVLPTNEELLIAKDTYEIIKGAMYA